MSDTQQLMTLQDGAEYLKVSKSTLYSWRSKNENTGPTKGPRSIKLGKHVRYRRTDVDAWVAEHEESIDV